jgi:hypothetical protein
VWILLESCSIDAWIQRGVLVLIGHWNTKDSGSCLNMDCEQNVLAGDRRSPFSIIFALASLLLTLFAVSSI